MTHTSQEYSEELLKKMKHWGVIKDENYFEDFSSMKIVPVAADSFNFDTYMLGWHGIKSKVEEQQNLRTRVKVLESCCELLVQKIQELEERQNIKEKLTDSERIYSENKTEIEKKYFGKIIAIDNSKRKVVGSGNTILEAYHNAKKNEPSKAKFSYIRVGYTDRL